MIIKNGVDGVGVFSEKEYQQGDLIIEMAGILRFEPTKYSVQVGVHKHLELENSKISDQNEAYAWRYLNHNCAPNIRIKGFLVYALNDITTGEELRFNYNSTEWEIAEPFQCHCKVCEGKWVQGFKFLTNAERSTLFPVLADHLKVVVNESMD